MRQLRRMTALIPALACLTGVPGQATAAPIVYTFSGIAAGSIGGTNFSHEAFQITVNADTSGVTTSPDGFTTLPNQPAEITLSSIGTATITGGATVQVLALLGGIPAVDLIVPAIGSPPDFVWIQVGDPVFGTYDLRTSIGPITGGPGSAFSAIVVPTNLGDVFILPDGANPTFTAQLTGGEVPEPAALVMSLIGGGLAGSVALRKRSRGAS